MAFLAVIVAGAACQFGQVDVFEQEPNNTKGSATPALLAPGDALTGFSGSVNDHDYFLVRTAARPGITRYRLTVTTDGQQGHTLRIRGRNQAAGVIGTLDQVVQISSPSTSPPRHVMWYGLGPDEPRVYVSVTGTSQTLQQYFAVLDAETTTPTSLPGGALAPGSVTISTRNQGNSANTDMWLYDAQLGAIDGAGNDDAPGSSGTHQSTLTRTLAPGRYTLAIAAGNLANHFPSPADDALRNQAVMDFAGVVASADSDILSNDGLSVSFQTPFETRTLPLAESSAFSVAFVSFTVGAAGCNGADIGTEGDPSPNAGPDGFITGVDFDTFVFAYFTEYATPGGLLVADLTDGTGEGSPDGFITGTDFDRFVELYFLGC